MVGPPTSPNQSTDLRRVSMHLHKSRPSNRAQMHDANGANDTARDAADWPPSSDAKDDEED